MTTQPTRAETNVDALRYRERDRGRGVPRELHVELAVGAVTLLPGEPRRASSRRLYFGELKYD